MDARLVNYVRRLAIVPGLLLGLMLASPVALSQEVDTVAPVIELEELTESVADRSQVFTAQIGEDNELKSVTLYYRREGQLPFTPAPMEPLGNSGYFSVSIPTDFNDLRAIEYYVQAMDATGNRTVSGFAFDPYRRDLTAPPSPLSSAGEPRSQADVAGSEDTPLLKRRWVQVVLGVLAVGVVASLVTDDGEDSEVVPLTFSLQ